MKHDRSEPWRADRVLGWTGAGALVSLATLCSMLGVVAVFSTGASGLRAPDGQDTNDGINPMVAAYTAIGVGLCLVGLGLLWWAAATLKAYRISPGVAAFFEGWALSVCWEAFTIAVNLSVPIWSLPAPIAFMVSTGFTAPLGVILGLTYIAVRIIVGVASRRDRVANQRGI